MSEGTTLHLENITAKVLKKANPDFPITESGWERYLTEHAAGLAKCIEDAQTKFLCKTLLEPAFRGEKYFLDDELCS